MYSPDEVLLNLDMLGGDVKPGSLMSITVLKPEFDKAPISHGGLHKQSSDPNSKFTTLPGQVEEPSGKKYTFVVKDLPKQVKARQPHLEIYVVKHIADAFGMKSGSQVLLAAVRYLLPSTPVTYQVT
jgi:DEP domain-containing protein 5